MSVSPRLILLDPRDNVLVCATSIEPGDSLLIDGMTVVAAGNIGMGHKIARQDLHLGDKVYKYGAPIGHVTAPTAIGAHVHTHNMVSDYIDHGGIHRDN